MGRLGLHTVVTTELRSRVLPLKTRGATNCVIVLVIDSFSNKLRGNDIALCNRVAKLTSLVDSMLFVHVYYQIYFIAMMSRDSGWVQPSNDFSHD